MKKKILAIMMVMVMAIGLTACSGGDIDDGVFKDDYYEKVEESDKDKVDKKDTEDKKEESKDESKEEDKKDEVADKPAEKPSEPTKPVDKPVTPPSGGGSNGGGNSGNKPSGHTHNWVAQTGTKTVQKPYQEQVAYTEQEAYTTTETKYKTENTSHWDVVCNGCGQAFCSNDELTYHGYCTPAGPNCGCSGSCKEHVTGTKQVPYEETVTKYRPVTKYKTETKYKNVQESYTYYTCSCGATK